MSLTAILSEIDGGDDKGVGKLLQKYNLENSHTFAFDHKEEDARIELCQGLLKVLRRSDHPLCQSTCLETLRILSRDKRVLGPVTTKEGILTLAGLARIHVVGHDGEPLEEAQSAEEERVVVEALKCLCNVVFNSVPAQQVGADVKLAEGLCARLPSVSSSHHEVGLFSLRLLFLLSALRTDVRGMLQKEAGAVRLLTDILERTLDVRWVGPYEAEAPKPEALPISSENNELAMEALKALFNITMSDSSDEVLPPLKDVKERPEIGCTVRNKLVRLMTHVDMAVKQGAAEFLFVLCKESVDNLLKYTGYGNAAGLLMARGLLAGGRGETQYSSDEDSDTEEYKSAKPFINPITGHIELPMPNPMEEMTEEQKEYEAQKLVKMIDELSRKELIRPMGVRKDGTLAPLGEAIHECSPPPSSDSDSD
uniref:Synembryn n=1 Tax=Cyprinus carpio carpio TaxID=630221 RepID=A0A8C1FRE1_CYPCA